MKFFKSVVQTMKDTTWLNAKETRRDTTTVVVMSIAFAVFLRRCRLCRSGKIKTYELPDLKDWSNQSFLL